MRPYLGGAPSQADEEAEADVSQLMDDETGMSEFVWPNDSGRMGVLQLLSRA
jgi:hypothetical protein